MSNYVRERIVQVIAIIVKRQSIDDMGADRRQVLAEVKQLIVGGNMQVTYMKKGHFIKISLEIKLFHRSFDAPFTQPTPALPLAQPDRSQCFFWLISLNLVIKYLAN